MSIREAQSRLSELRSQHSVRNDRSAELKALLQDVTRLSADGSDKERIQSLWIEQEISSMLEYRARQWSILDQLEKSDATNALRIAKSRMTLLILWSREAGADAPKLQYAEFRVRARNLAATLPSEGSSVFQRMLFTANLPHLLPEFRGKETGDAALTALWDDCVRLTARPGEHEEELIALAQKLLAVPEEMAANQIYLFVTSLQLHGHRAALSALAYPATVSPEVPEVPTPATILKGMVARFSKPQLGMALDYLAKRYFLEIFSFSYLSDEETRRMVSGYKFTALRGQSKKSIAQVTNIFRLLTSRFSFWQDPAERKAVLLQVRQLLEPADVKNQDWQQVMGMVEWLDQNEKAASGHLVASAQLRNAGKDMSKAFVSTFCPYEELSITEENYRGYALEATRADLSALDEARKVDYPGLLVTVADSKYFMRYGKAYAESLRVHDSEAPVLFHVIDLNDEARALFADLSLKFTNIFLSSETAIHPRPFYFAVVRLLRACDIVTRVQKPVFFTDIDSTFRVGTRHVFEYGAKFDLMLRVYDRIRLFGTPKNTTIVRYPKIEPWGRVNAAALLFSPSEMGLKMADLTRQTAAAFITKCGGQNATNWWMDQNILYQFERMIAGRKDIRRGNFEDLHIPYACFSHIKLSDPDKLLAWRRDVLHEQY